MQTRPSPCRVRTVAKARDRARMSVELNTPVTPVLADHPGRPASHDEPVLELDQVSINFGGVRALDKLSLRLNAGDIRGLIGPSGSGKSTPFNVIPGLYRPSGGEIRVAGRSILGLRADQIASRGVARTFQT